MWSPENLSWLPGVHGTCAALGPLGQAQTSTGPLLIAIGVVAVCATIGVGVSVLWRRRPLIGNGDTFFRRLGLGGTQPGHVPAPGADAPSRGFQPARPEGGGSETARPKGRGSETARADGPSFELALAPRLCAAFAAWLVENEQSGDLWTPFEQLLREQLGELLGAARVRCYHVQPGDESLQPISLTAKKPGSHGPSAREGILGHAATTGQEYVAEDAAHGPLVDELAAQADQSWTWVWPVRAGDTTIGLVAIGSLAALRGPADAAPSSGALPSALHGEVRETAGRLLSLFWQHVACRDQLRTVRMTDRGSGVLTRGDFFALATPALTNSYQQGEPVVVTALAVEGLRHLDDTGHWQDRDTLVERIGRLIAQRVRADDLVARFADDRFVVLLRRLDSGLGRLIAEQLVAAAADCLRAADPTGAHVKLRVGLAGSGFGQPPLQDLLVSAFAAVERGRHANETVSTDLQEPKSEANPA